MAGDGGQPLNSLESVPARSDGGREEDQAARLPGDVLADILRRVRPRWLAASRCVCRAWRDAIDGHRLLRADLLPLSLAGLFVHYNEHKYPEFLHARPSLAAGGRAVSGDLSFLPSTNSTCWGYYWLWAHGPHGRGDLDDYNIEDHCNGLLLLRDDYVVNPATRRWNTLPACPDERSAGNEDSRAHLVYDPMVSPHYEVVKIPTLGEYHRVAEVDPLMEEAEWPPSLCKMYVYSSKSGCWELKDFVREGDAAGTIGEMRGLGDYAESTAAYFRGALYAHLEANFLIRVSLSNNTYSVIKPPMPFEENRYVDINIERSEKGVYFVALASSYPWDKCWLRVWILNESCGQMKWMLKHDKDLKVMLPRQCFRRRVKWILENINYNLFLASRSQEDSKKETAKEKLECNSDEDAEGKDMVDRVENKLELNSNNESALNYGGLLEDCFRHGDIELLGFHPYKEIVFLSAEQRTCLAYHLNDSKIEELGNIYPKEYGSFKLIPNEQEHLKSFPYTPCWIEEFPGNN